MNKRTKIALYTMIGLACAISTILLVGGLIFKNPFLVGNATFFMGGAIVLLCAGLTGIFIMYFRR